VVKSVRVGDISELSLVPSISMYSKIWYFCCVGVMYSGEYDVCHFVVLLWACVHTGQDEKIAWPRWEGVCIHTGQADHCGQANFSPCPVWMHTHAQSNIANIISPEYLTPTHKKVCVTFS
jgi:hypothetical protein